MSKRKYERPSIMKLHAQLASKHGTASHLQSRVRKDIDGVLLSDLTKKFGSPLYVYSEKTIKNRYLKAEKAFKSRYANTQFAWSYKTNYLKAICALFHKLGSIAEVVSDFEYEKARNIGVDGRDIIYNGPYKPNDSLKIAATDGAKIHIDTFGEISDLEKIADELKIKIPVTIRINMDTGIYPQWSRFGFNLESGQALDAVNRIHAGGKLKLTGLHSHIGTFVLLPSAYGIGIDKLLKFSDEVESLFKYKIEYIDIGGGFASKSRLKGIYQPPEVVVPDVDSYAEEICSVMNRYVDGGKNGPKLFLETGRHMIDEAGYLITTVVGQKTLIDGRRSYIMDAGVNLLYTSTWYNFNVEMEKEHESINEPAVLNGPLCMNIDVIEESVMLPRLANGERLVLSPVGAYNPVQSMQFIRYRPAVVLIRENGDVDLIRGADDLKTVEHQEKMPTDLA